MSEPKGPAAVRADSIPFRVVRAVAHREGVDPTDLSTPLYEAIDPDALENVFRHHVGDGSGRIQFNYHGYRVTVDDAGGVSVEDRQNR